MSQNRNQIFLLKTFFPIFFTFYFHFYLKEARKILMNLQLKYDKLKEKASKWYDYSYELENKVETLSEELQLLKTKNEELLEHEKENNKTVRSLKRQFREEK